MKLPLPRGDVRFGTTCPGTSLHRGAKHRNVRTLLGPACLLVVGCQSYSPRPLQPDVHRAEWHGRRLEDGTLAAFAHELEQDLDPRATAFDPTDGLNLAEGRLVALVHHPELRQARLRLERSAVDAREVSHWADPQLSVSALRITESVPDRWVASAGLGFTLPISGRLGARREAAGTAVQVAELRALEAEWRVWRSVREGWIEWTAADLRVRRTEQLVASLKDLVESVEGLVQVGELLRPEAALFNLEKAQRENELRRLRAVRLEAEQELRARLGLAPEAPVLFQPDLGEEGPSDLSPEEIAERSPELARLRGEYALREAELKTEIRKQFPDLTLGPEFESDQGQSRIGLVGGLPLPIWNANREGITRARSERELARAASELAYEALIGRHARFVEQLEGLSEQRKDLEQTLIPMLDRQLSDVMELLELGEGSALLLLESQRQAFEGRLEWIDVRMDEALARAELEYLCGPPPSRALSDTTDPTETR